MLRPGWDAQDTAGMLLSLHTLSLTAQEPTAAPPRVTAHAAHSAQVPTAWPCRALGAGLESLPRAVRVPSFRPHSAATPHSPHSPPMLAFRKLSDSHTEWQGG